MIGKTNVGGGSSNSAWAYIGVTYPSGSTCSATNGSLTLNASGTSGLFVFQIPEPTSTPETWTVSCTNGTQTKSETVSVTSQYQNIVVTLTYSRLPVGYQEVEYLEGSGTQYIVVGAVTFTDYEIDVVFNNFGVSNTSPACGGSGQNTVLQLGFKNTTDYQNKIVYRENSTIYAGNKFINEKISLKYNDASHQVVEDDVVIHNSATQNYSGNFCLFCGKSTLGQGNIMSGRIFSCMVINKSTDAAVYNFVPCYRTSDNVAGFYDLANDVFMTNNGTGNFGVGADVL